MNNKYLIGSIFGVVALLAIGGYIGFIIGSLSNLKAGNEISRRQKDMQFRTESYTPTCDQLKSMGKPELMKKDKDYFIVDTSENYVVVFGFNAEPGKVPVTAWWGAGRKELMNQTCNNKK